MLKIEHDDESTSTNYNGGLKVSSIFSSHWCCICAELNSLIRKHGTGEPGRYAKKKRMLSIPSTKLQPKEAPFWSVVETHRCS